MNENGQCVVPAIKGTLNKLWAQEFNSFGPHIKVFYYLGGGWKPAVCIKCHVLIFLTCDCGQSKNI
jgi:hypothetical protein